MIDIDPITRLDQQHTMSGLTVSHMRTQGATGEDGGRGDTCFNNYCFNKYHLTTVQGVANSSDLVNRPGYTGKPGRTGSVDMPGKFEARKTGVHRTPTNEGFCFGNTAGIF